MTARKALVLFVSAIICFVDGKCPPVSEVSPCTCTDTPLTITCSNIKNSVDMDTVFQRSSGWELTSIAIDNCLMQFIPKSVMENPRFDNLDITNSHFVTLFEAIEKKGADIKKLLISNVTVVGSYDWSFLATNTRLAEFNIHNSTVGVFGESFQKNMPSGIVTMKLLNTKTKKITHEAFSKLKSLSIFYLTGSYLTQISRNMFPKPWNTIVWLDLSYNKLSSFPEDIFNDMPSLSAIRLMNNRFRTLPLKPFSLKPPNVTRLYMMGGNPIVCNCAIKWVLTTNGVSVMGECAEPKEFKGKEIGSLKPSDLSFCS